MSIRIRKLFWNCNALLLLCSSCYKNHLYVQEEWVDRESLASSKIGTPDPRQDNPPEGQRLLIAWDFPRSLYREELTVAATVRFWDNEQEVLLYPVERKRGYTSFFFPKEKILTYRIDVWTKDGKLLESWKHHFWTELIEIGSKEAAAKSSSSVSSQPMHESVSETP